MNRRLVLLRHGRTEWNHTRRVQGQQDAHLDDVGLAQAAEVAPVLAQLRPAVLWSSDLSRAAVTASYVAKATGLEVRHDPRLREFSLGVREGLTHTEFEAAAPEEFAAFLRGNYDVVPGAETADVVRERMVACLRELWALLGPDDCGIAVAHGAAIRVAAGGLCGWPDEQYATLRALDNCGWVELVEHPDGDRLRMLAYNRTASPHTGPVRPIGA